MELVATIPVKLAGASELMRSGDGDEVSEPRVDGSGKWS